MLSGCGSGGGGRLVETTSNARPSPAANDRIDRCVDRLLQGAKHQTGADKEAVRRYARNTYCSRFEQELRRRLDTLAADAEAERAVLDARLRELAKRIDETLART